jgi:hypothetical protein
VHPSLLHTFRSCFFFSAVFLFSIGRRLIVVNIRLIVVNIRLIIVNMRLMLSVPFAISSHPGIIGATNTAFPVLYRTMVHANPTNLDCIGTPLLAEYLHFRTMAHSTNPTTMGFNGTPTLAAYLNPRAVQPANSSRDGLIGTPILAASLPILCRTMAHANPTNLGFIVTPLHAVYLHFRTMAHATNPTTMDFIGNPSLLQTLTLAPCNLQTPPEMA